MQNINQYVAIKCELLQNVNILSSAQYARYNKKSKTKFPFLPTTVIKHVTYMQPRAREPIGKRGSKFFLSLNT